MQEVMKKRAVELLSDGTVSKVIGWMPGEFSYDMTPAVFTTVDEINENFVYNDFCGANVSKYVMKEQKKDADAKILVFLKPCDTYSFNQLTAEHKIVVTTCTSSASAVTAWRTWTRSRRPASKVSPVSKATAKTSS